MKRVSFIRAAVGGIIKQIQMFALRVYKKMLPIAVRHLIAELAIVRRLRCSFAHLSHRMSGKCVVWFFVQRRALWPNYASIYDAMRNDSSFEAEVLVAPKRTPHSKEYDFKEYAELQADLARMQIPFRKLYDERGGYPIIPLDYGIPDVVFLSTPYEDQNIYTCRSQFWKTIAKIAYVPYGILLANLPQIQYQLPFFKNCWRIFVESEAHKELYRKHNHEIYDRTVLTGHPKLDAYLKPAKSAGLWKLTGARKRIIWAPHFTVSDTVIITFSNFIIYYDFFVQLARELPDVEFILRPHPELFEFMVSVGLRTRDESNAYRDVFNALPNGQVYEGANIFEMFKESDALILDSIGFLAEYLPTQKPICFLESDRRQKLNEVGEALLRAYYCAWSEEEIDRFIRDVVLNERDVLLEDRLAVMRQHILLPSHGAGNRIMNNIRKMDA